MVLCFSILFSTNVFAIGGAENNQTNIESATAYVMQQIQETYETMEESTWTPQTAVSDSL